MSQEKNCIFCAGPITEGDICTWCGFDQRSEKTIPGTLDYGTKLNMYTVGDVIAVDGESTSYMAYDTQSETKVILKEFLPVSMVAPRTNHNVNIQPGKEVLFKNLMMDFTDLYNVLKKIDNKALQKVKSVFNANNTVYAVLENVKGDTLKQNLIKRGKTYTFKEARWLFQDLFLLMKQLENANIAHGGISDETVIITPENNIVLGGFAIADLRVKNEHIVYKLYDGFAAPEQYEINGFSGFYTDIFSVAVLFNYAVTGRTWQENMFNSKLTDRHIPKYAAIALDRATLTDRSKRIDNIEDFVLILDGKAEIQKKPEKKQPPAKTGPDMAKFMPYFAVTLIMALFIGAMFSVNNSRSTSQSQPSTSDEIISSQSQLITVPYMIGENYSRVMNNPRYTQNLYFYMDEEYSTTYPKGRIISHNPRPDRQVAPGTLIYLTVSKGAPMLTVPEGLTGMDSEQAGNILSNMGIQYVVLYKVQTTQFPQGTVQGTDKMPGTPIDPRKDFLVLYVSDNTPLAE